MAEPCPPPDGPRFWRPSAVARRTGLSKRTVERYCADGTIAAAHRSPGGHWRIPRASVEAFVRGLRAAA